MSGFLDRLWSRAPAAPATAAEPADLFPCALAIVLVHEGGAKVTNDPADPGGLTKYGISKRANPDLDIANLTEAQAGAIYRERYWTPCRCGEMPWPVALVVFDCAVNMGVGRAARLLQMALRVPADGAIGPKTLAALASADALAVAREIQAQRIMAYVALPGWGRFGLGWTRRAMSVMADAAG